MPFRMVAKPERAGDHADFSRKLGQETAHEPSGGASGRHIVDSDEPSAHGGWMVGHQRHHVHAPVLQPVDGGAHFRKGGRDHGDPVADRLVQDRQRSGDTMRVEGVDRFDVNVDAFSRKRFGMFARLAAQVFHEGVRAVGDQELKPVIALLGEIGSEDVPGIF